MAESRARVGGLKAISIRLRGVDIALARREGKRRAMPYQTVIRGWIVEKAEAARAVEPR